MIPLDEANLRCCVLRYVSRTGQLAANKTGWLAMFLYFLVTYVCKIWCVKPAWFDLCISPQVVPHIYWPYFPILFEQRYPELADFPNDASLSRLQAWPVKYVLVDHADMPSELGAAIERQPRLNLVVTVGDVDVYAIVAGK